MVGLLLIATLAMHAYFGLLVGELNTALRADLQRRQGGRPPHLAAISQPLNVPEYRWDGTERINFLLLGIDAGAGRQEALTDTILVVSVDPVAKTAVMVSVPRDTGSLPLPDSNVYTDGVYPQKINQLSTDADADPEPLVP